jgi:arsenate reductase
MTGGFDPERLVRQFQALGQSSRLAVVRLLARYRPFGLGAGEIARLVAVPHNTLSTHLAELERAGLIRSRRNGRSIVYALDPETAEAIPAQLAEILRPPGRAPGATTVFLPIRRTPIVTDRTYNVLVLCTGNSARSILAEALINREGKGKFHAFSAGSHPKGTPNPVGLKLLAELGYDISGFRSKSWDEFAGPGAPKMDFIVTVCDSAAGEACPYWPGHPLTAHWGIPDPADVGETEEERRAAFLDAYRRLAARVTAFVNLPVETMDLGALKAALAEIGRLEGATDLALAGKVA